jgi:hypothetical protein
MIPPDIWPYHTQSVVLTDRTICIFHENMFSFIVRLAISRYRNKFMNVAMWEHWSNDSHIFWHGRVYYPWLHYYNYSCANCYSELLGRKYLPYLLWQWNLLTKFLYCTSGIYQMHVLLQHRTCPLYHQLYLFLGPELSERLYHTSDPLVLCIT